MSAPRVAEGERPDRAGWPCACGCLMVVQPFSGKGVHARRYATPACGNRVRQRRWRKKVKKEERS